MKSLETIQKTYRVFQTLTKIFMILSFVWAGLAGLGLLCGVVWYSGGRVVGGSQEMMQLLMHTDSLKQMFGVLLADVVSALTDGILLAYAYRYLKKELADGTPFTQSGADQIQRLGIRTIVLPLVAVILSAVFYEVFDVAQTLRTESGNLPSLTMGIVLILVSLIFRYGAELEGRKKMGETT